MYAHIICVNWLQGVWFKDERNEVVEGEIESLCMTIPCMSMNCKLDKVKDQGAVI